MYANLALGKKSREIGDTMLRFFDVIVQVVYIVESGRIFVVLNEGQLAALSEPAQFSWTHAEIPGGILCPQ